MNIYEDTQMQNDNEFHANASNGNIENFDCDAFIKSTYKSINSFYGVFYDNYTTLKTMLIWRLPFLIAFLGVTFFLAPFTYSTSSNIFAALFPIVVVGGMNIGIYQLTKHKKYNMFYYKYKGKLVTIYWDKNRKKELIINFGDVKLKYYLKHKIWDESVDLLCNRKLYFNHLKNNLVIKNKKDGIKLINSYNYDYGKKYIETTLKLQNDIPLSIEHRLPRLSDRVEKSYNTINRNIVRRIDFIEINKDRFVEIPKSIITFCEKNNIQPPEENEYLHYVD